METANCIVHVIFVLHNAMKTLDQSKRTFYPNYFINLVLNFSILHFYMFQFTEAALNKTCVISPEDYSPKRQ